MCPRDPKASPPDAIAFTDGACSGNPGPGGWGAIVISQRGDPADQEVRELGGSAAATTNNRMELQGPIAVLSQLPSEWTSVSIYTDSTYVIRGVTQWVWGWMKRGWVTAEGKEVLNQDLWKRLLELTRPRKITWHYVRGHAGIAGNDRVDEIAVAFSRNGGTSLYRGSLRDYSVSIFPLPTETDLPEPRSPASGKPSAPFAYLSLVGGVAERHATWKLCEARVKGQSGARFKKAMSATDETEILRSWGVDPRQVRPKGE